MDCDLFFFALEFECDSVQSWKKNFSLHRTFAQPSLHFKQNFSGVVYAPLPREVFMTINRKK